MNQEAPIAKNENFSKFWRNKINLSELRLMRALVEGEKEKCKFILQKS